MPALAMLLSCSEWACRQCWTDSNFGEVLRIDAQSGAVSVLDEGFAGDDIAGELSNPSFKAYECTDSGSDAHCGTDDGVWHCACVFPNGSWSGDAAPQQRLLALGSTASAEPSLRWSAASAAGVLVAVLGLAVWSRQRLRGGVETRPKELADEAPFYSTPYVEG